MHFYNLYLYVAQAKYDLTLNAVNYSRRLITD